VGALCLGTQRTSHLQHVPVISIVDDDESVRIAMNSLVRSLGYIAHTFASAEDFLRSPRLNETSCLITDVQMPGMNGIELQTQLRAKGLRMPIVFITAYPDERTRARSLDAGAVCYLTKPFDEETLIGCLERALKA
jgi:FixJ family two-component response regulator